MRVLKLLKWLVIVVACVFVLVQFKRPARTNPPIDQPQTIEAQTQMTPQVSAILDRSCRDCHSNRTVWPWYTNISPVSWFTTDHVNEGRKDLNLSEWGKLSKDRQAKKLQQMCDLVQDGVMPLNVYTPLHAGSKPGPYEVKTLCAWTDAERTRLNSN
jgi:hypothetical protein